MTQVKMFIHFNSTCFGIIMPIVRKRTE